MKNKTKKEIAFIILTTLLLVGFASAIETDLTYSADSTVQLKKLKYEPYPVNPGEYFDLWISAQYIGSSGADNIIFELVPEYPFSLDPSENATRNYGKLNSPSIVLDYKVRVDEDAIEGTNQIKLNYKIGNKWFTKTFDIEVSDSQTSFDAVIQEVSSSEISIALANIGKNPANSVVVRVPEQDNFIAVGTDGQMVGNLDAGDYTIVSFSLTSIQNRNPEQETVLKFDIYYTDEIGERRTVNMELPLNLGNAVMSGDVDFEQRMLERQKMYGSFDQKSSSKWRIWVLIIAIIAIGGYFYYKKNSSKFKSKKSDNPKKNKRLKKEKNNSEIPEWAEKAINDKDKKKG